MVTGWSSARRNRITSMKPVMRFEAGAGFMGCDLAWVRYQLPRDASEHEMPFGTANLDRGDPQALLARAARHEEQAAKLRAMADEVAK